MTLTLQDRVRLDDRIRIEHARRTGQRRRLAWLLMGPGVLVMLGENDGPSMISYATDGAAYGLGFFLPFTVVLFALAYVCQEMCMRVGAVTHRGYGELVLQRYGRVWGWFGAGDLAVTNLVTLISEFVAIRVGLAYFGIGAPVAAVGGVLLVAVAASSRRYRRWERIVLGLAVFNALFLVAAVLTRPQWSNVGHALATVTPLPTGPVNTVLLLIASTVGATVTPWMVFFQQSAGSDKGIAAGDLGHGRFDTAIGAALAAVFGCGAVICGAALFGRGGGSIQGLDGAGFPAALAGVCGHPVAALFAVGLIEAGAVAVLTISASTAYAAAECVGAAPSFNADPRRSRLFFGVNVAAAMLAAVIILIPHVPLLAIALNANVLATVLLPVTLVFLIMLANDRTLMGKHANHRITNIIAGATIALITLAALGYAVCSFLQAIHAIPAGS